MNSSTLLSSGPQKLKMRFPNDSYAEAERKHADDVTPVRVFHSVTLVWTLWTDLWQSPDLRKIFCDSNIGLHTNHRMYCRSMGWTNMAVGQNTMT